MGSVARRRVANRTFKSLPSRMERRSTVDSMNNEQAEKELRARIAITPQRVTIAKALLLESAGTSPVNTDELLTAVVKANGSPWPLPKLVIHESVDTMSTVKAVADAISWRLAAIEATWSLIHSGLLFSMAGTRDHEVSVDWTTVAPGSGGGMSSGFRMPETSLPVPDRVRRALSFDQQKTQFLAEPDLYLHTFGVDNMHRQVSDSFAEAVRCFRAELYTASLAMLGRASEGAWLELGEALLRLVPATEQKKYSKQRHALEDPMLGTMKKVGAVIAMYEHQELFEPVAKASEVRLQELREVANWTDTVRDSRNTIHFRVDAAVPNTYEKLGVLLLGAVPNVRTLYRAKTAADAIAPA